MSERFYVNSELAPGLLVLRGPEAHHLAAVCRARPGDMVRFFNGDGREATARITEVSKRDVALEVLSVAVVDRELPQPLHLAAPLPKGDRAQFLVEKLTELGVSRLTVLSTERSVVQPREAKMERLERYVVEASKQCGRNVLMAIEGPRTWADLVRDVTLPAQRWLAHPGTATRPLRAPGELVAAVGPEGGLTDAEVRLALDAGWQAVDLGPRILRVETAALLLACLGG